MPDVVACQRPFQDDTHCVLACGCTVNVRQAENACVEHEIWLLHCRIHNINVTERPKRTRQCTLYQATGLLGNMNCNSEPGPGGLAFGWGYRTDG